MTILFYILTIIIERILGFSSIVSFPLTLLIGKLTKNLNISAAIGTFITFYLYNYLWNIFEGGNIPYILLLFILISEIGLMNSDKLTLAGYKYTKGIIIGEVVFLMYMSFFEKIRFI